MKGMLSGRPWELNISCPPVPWREELAQCPERKLKIGYYTDDGVVMVQPPIRRAVEEVVEKLKTAGHTGIEPANAGAISHRTKRKKAIICEVARLTYVGDSD
jgi:Asp-tRNA(Asn)/Glu-tRNA(Gln) amidotransferase A subunit family amidase